LYCSISHGYVLYLDGPLTPETPDSKSAFLYFDWKPKYFSKDTSKELITFALPHHVDILQNLETSSNEVIGHCMHSLHGKVCLVKGGQWAMEEVLGGLPSFVSPRPANHKAISALSKALSDDIHYSLPYNFMKGAGDTYFSGKMLAKLGRIIVVAQELRGLAEGGSDGISEDQELLEIVKACKNASLPTEIDVVNAIGRLREGVEVWLNGTASAPFTFDNSWGGLVSCGCLFNGKLSLHLPSL
jgi:endoglucanase Acf2